MAISDATATLARPLAVIRPSSLETDGPQVVAERIGRLRAEEDDIETLVVGLPSRLDGSDNEMTSRVREFATALGHLTGLSVVFQDERLTSREAEHLMSATDRDWRSRKKRLDAVAAAVILQEYLDAHPSGPLHGSIDSDS